MAAFDVVRQCCCFHREAKLELAGYRDHVTAGLPVNVGPCSLLQRDTLPACLPDLVWLCTPLPAEAAQSGKWARNLVQSCSRGLRSSS